MIRLKMFFNTMILAAVLILPLSAQNKETLAVLDFQTEAVSKTEMSAIVEFLSSELFNTDKYIVIDVSQRQTILKEMEFSNSGCTDDSCALEIGKLLSAELIVTGNLSKVGSRYLMSTKMLETETSRTVGTANGKYNDLDELIDGLEEIAATLTGADTAKTETAAETEPVPDEEPNAEAGLAAEAEPAGETGDRAADASTTAAKAVETDKGKTESSESEIPEMSAQPDSLNLPSFLVSTIGAVGYTAAGVFSGFSFKTG